MAAVVKQRFILDPAAQELWRVAETGDVHEFERLLPRVNDVNARNKYGMTALMKAAYHGHERMVRALLEHGANPNLTRNDRFTALALAAFFGHTETVRTLIEYGAKTEVVTRCGASAGMWATARTFDEAARCLKQRSPVPKAPPATPSLVALPAPVSTPAPVVVNTVVKTLKEPPEIWDLVHEEPRSFNPRSAFISRLTSMKRTFVLGVFAGVLVIVGCGVGALFLRNSQARNPQAELPQAPSVAESTVNQPTDVQSQNSSVSVSEPAAVEAPSDTAVNNHRVGIKKASVTRHNRSRSIPEENVIENVEVTQPPAAPAIATPRVESQNAAKPNIALSPQLIVPSKNAPPKAKVIQWP